MRKIITFVLYFIIGISTKGMAQQVNCELQELVADANIEMKQTFGMMIRRFELTGAVAENLRNKRLVIKNDSVIYICPEHINIVSKFKYSKEQREKQSYVYMFSDMRPKFRSLIMYMIDHNKSLYQVYQTLDGKIYTPYVEYNSQVLRRFTSNSK